MNFDKQPTPQAENNAKEEKVDGRRSVLRMESINNATGEGNPIKVIVERSSGEREDDWYAVGSDGEVVTVHKYDGNGGFLQKEVPLEDLKEWNSLFSKNQRESIAELADRFNVSKN